MYYNRKIKISLDQITYGPKVPEVDGLVSRVYAQDLLTKGYRRTSNAYCMVSRIDRNDWIEVLAKQLHCAPADFYKLDGTGIDDRWRDHYVRCYSKDTLTVHPDILRFVPGY